MNFLSAVVEGNGRRVRLGEAVAFPLAGEGLPGEDGRSVTVGIRPEHLYIDGVSPLVELNVELVEHLGATTLVQAWLEETLITVSVDGAVAVAPGDILPLSLDSTALHLFDAERETRIEPAAPPAAAIPRFLTGRE